MMKNVSTKLIAGVAVLGIAGAAFAFASGDKPDESKKKKYEVVRMVDGELVQHDTIIAAASEYSPQDYLNDLGYGEDEHINIINLLDLDVMHHEMTEIHEMHSGDHTKDHKGEHMIFIEMDEDEFHHEMKEGDEHHEIRIEKKIIKSDENGDEVTIDINAMIEDMNIDSMIQVAMKMEGSDSGAVVMHKMIVLDEEFERDMEGKMEWHEMNAEDADFHKEVSGPGHHMEVAVWGDDHEDFTLLIVTDPDHSPKGPAGIDNDNEDSNTSVKLFPNPTENTSQLQLNFEDEAETSIEISDIKGRVVQKLALGEFSGEYILDIDVQDWAKGVYIVKVQHGSDKTIQKLIVE